MRWRYFMASDFDCRCGCRKNLMHPEFIDKLDELREQCGFALQVSSGYRCPEHNARVSSTGADGPHTQGVAVDLLVDRGRAYEVLRLAFAMGFRGIGVKQHGSGRFIHLDDVTDGPRPTVWSYG